MILLPARENITLSSVFNILLFNYFYVILAMQLTLEYAAKSLSSREIQYLINNY